MSGRERSRASRYVPGKRIPGATLVWALGGMLLGGGAGCAAGGAGGTSSSPSRAAADGIGRSAPEIVVERLSGEKLALSSLRGKVVLLDVWASWCVPCKKELPMLDAIARRLGGRGVEILAVSIDQKRSNVVKFLNSQPRWALTVAHDPGGIIADTLQPEKMPTSYVIDRAGVIRYVNGGFEPADAAVIERRLADLAADDGGELGADGGGGGKRAGHGRP